MLKNVPISKDANLAVSHLLMMVNHIASMENKLIPMATWTERGHFSTPLVPFTERFAIADYC